MRQFISLQGSYYDIGYQIGNLFSNKINKYINVRYESISNEFANFNLAFRRENYYKYSDSLISSLLKHTPNEYSELRGIADGSGNIIEDIIFGLGYSDIFDLLYKEARLHSSNPESDECTSFITPPNYSRSEKYITGQNWDMPPETEDYVVLLHKKPESGMELYSLTTVLGLTHMGMNSNGTCIGTTNVATSDVGCGVIFSALIQSALSRTTINDSIKIFNNLPKVSGHFYYLASENTAFAVEVSASYCIVDEIKNKSYIHSNHYKNKLFLPNAINYSPTSEYRERFLSKTIEDNKGLLTIDDFKLILSSHEGNICRHSLTNEKIYSQTIGSIIFCPHDKRIIISFGKPCENIWHEFSI